MEISRPALCRRLGTAAFVLAWTWTALSGSYALAQSSAEPTAQTVRLLSPPGRIAEGKTEIEALLIDPDIHELVFLVDGEEADRRKKLPWKGEITLRSPPRPQTVTVRALGKTGRTLGEDSIELNRVYRPLRVRLGDLGGATGDHVVVSGEVSLPYGAELDRVDVYVGDEPKATLRTAEFSGRITHPVQTGDLVRAVARLRDGRTVEDVRVFGVAHVERSDTYLVQVQVLVSRRDGPPIRGLGKDDFEIVERGVKRPVDRVLPADDVALRLGLVVDSSGSMERLWHPTRNAVQAFLGAVMADRDRVFLTTFADRVRLVEGLTDDPSEIDAAMAEIQPEGLTALYDSIVFSMLQFADEPGRRALVVITDGVDHGSTSDPDRVVTFGERLGIPIYVVAMQQRDVSRRGGFQAEAPIHALKLLTDPTGGRLLRTSARGGLGRAFQQITDELRGQYLLTFYTDRPIEDLSAGELEVKVPGRKKIEVRSVLAWDQIR